MKKEVCCRPRGPRVCNLAKLPSKCEESNTDPFQSQSMKPRDYLNGINILIFIIASTLVLFELDLKPGFTGVTVKISNVQAVLMFISTLTMIRGLKDNSWLFIVPWVIISACHCYTNQFKDIWALYRVFMTNDLGYTPWIALAFYCATFLLRIYMIFCVSHLTFQQWWNQELLKELVNV